jgi:hypothetical protein
MPMPETSMDENNRSVARQNYVRSSGKASGTDAKAKSRAMKEASYCDLGPGITAADAGHHPAPRVTIYDVGH